MKNFETLYVDGYATSMKIHVYEDGTARVDLNGQSISLSPEQKEQIIAFLKRFEK